MKTFTTLLIAIMISILAMGQDYELIPIKEITKIANRNAEALWGDVYPAEPIPYYGKDNKIIAWQFNYSIGNTFPTETDILTTCSDFRKSGDKFNQWGGDNFGHFLIGARNNMPVMLEYAKCLSSDYALKYKTKELSKKAFLEQEVTFGKIYYLNHFNTWQEITNAGETKYICTSPTGGIKTTSEYNLRKTEAKHFCETGDFKYLWEKYQDGFTVSGKADKYIPDHVYMPFYDWSYGCSPTAAAMLFAWYDNRSEITDYKYPYFVSWHYQRYDTLSDPPDYSCHWDYNVSNLQRDLALGMDTDTLTGNTKSYMLDNGMIQVANNSRGYSFDIEDYYTFLWTRTKNDIDDGKPLIVSIPGHSTTGVGYNDATDMAITHYTHSPPRHIVWVSRWSIDMTVRATKGGQKGSHVKIRVPHGDPRFSNDGEGEVYNVGNYAEILWDSDDVEGSWTDIFYSIDGGLSMQPVGFDIPNTGMYNWLIPPGVSSTKCRIMIHLRDPEMEPYIAGADGSWGNFIINAGGGISTMADGHLYENDRVSKFYLHEHNHPSWSVIGSHTDSLNCHWQLQLFDDEDFNEEPILQYAYGRNTNFIVLDGNHLSAEPRGVKHKPYGCSRTNYIQYEGGNDDLVLTPGASTQLNWHDDEIVKIYDIHLTPGQYYFRMHRISGGMDIDMAFMSSTDGNYIKDISEANYISDNYGGTEDSFIVNVDTEDDYGFVIFAKQMGSGIFSLKIENAYIWTGNVDRNWHNTGNWVGGVVPGWGDDVAIPNRVNDPNIYFAEAHCGKLNILTGGLITLTNYNLNIQDNFFVDGVVEINNPGLKVYCGNDVEMAAHGHLDFTGNAEMWVEGDWTFAEESYTDPDEGTVKFWGTENSIIHVKSENCRFNNLRISKTGGAFVAYDNCPGIEPLKIHGQFIIDDGAEFIQWALYNTIFEGPFLSYPGSKFSFVNGKAIFDYAGSGGIVINSEPGSYFNDLTISCANWAQLSGDIEIRGDLLIEEGLFKTMGNDVYIKGDWNDEAWGFNHGSSRVIFNGTGIQTSYGGAFWEMELNKSGGELRIRENTTGVQHYDWTQGTMRVNGGYFLANDLDDNGIYGTIIITSGTASLHQDATSYFDLNGNLEISGGELHLHGGNGMGFWPFAADASITMTDGLIDVHDNGIKIFNSASYNLETNITGGLIRINGSLHIHRDDFNPTGGTIELIGYEEDASLHSVEGANLFNVVVDKSSKKSKALAANLVATGILDINGDFNLNGGNFEAPETMRIFGQFNNNQTPAHFDELTGEVIFDGSGENNFEENEVFYDLTIRKPSDYFIVNENVSLGVNGTFNVDEGLAYFMPGSEITLGEALEVNYGGTLVLEGTEEDHISVNHGTSKLNYSFDIYPGGDIAAIHTIFIYMDLEGINIHSGAYVWPEGAFHNCSFAYGLPGGTCLTIDNGADLIIENANFSPNTTGMAHNITKNVDNGNVYFDEVTGDFSGPDYENDLFNRIHWEYIPPFELPFFEDWISADFETNIWTTTGINWVIDDEFGNDVPSAKFTFGPRILDYSQELRSYLLNGEPDDIITLSYDIAYEEFSAGTLEQITVRLVYPNGDYYNLANYTNDDGTFGFITETIDISEYASGEIFRVTFVAHGEDSWNIEKWNIDNIEVSGIPEEPGKLSGIVKDADGGALIENALVEIIGTSFNQLTNNLGEFNIVDIPTGFYNIRVSADGYIENIVNGIEIKPEENTNITVVLTQIPPSYCTNALYENGCTEGDGLDTFILNDIINEASGCSGDGYGDFTSMQTELGCGYPYQLELSSNYNAQYVSLWIDLNDDFEFAESEMLIEDFILPLNTQTYTTALNIPVSAQAGTHRLRVRTNWNSSSSDPCATYSYGEAEDYTVIINNSPALGGLKIYVGDDQNKGPVENATIELLGTNWFGITQQEGYCIIDFVEPGIYDLLITAENFEETITYGQYVFPGITTPVEIAITPMPVLTQNINLNKGWQGLSSFIMPQNNDIAEIFSPISNQLTLIYNYEEMYWPGAGIGTLKNWEHHAGFFIKMEDDATLNITGHAEPELTCAVPASWSILPVICPADVTIMELLDGGSSKASVVLIKEIAGTRIYWPEYNIQTLDALETGKAYSLLMDAPGEIIFPESPNKTTTAKTNWLYPNIAGWNIPVKTASSHIVVFPPDVLAHFNFDNNCWIGAFNQQGKCCGIAPVSDNTAISIFADDATTFQKDGFSDGEKIYFSIINTITLHEQNLNVELDESLPNSDGNFVREGLSVVKDVNISSIETGNNRGANISIYPNPSNGKVWIEGLKEEAEITIYDASGQKLLNRNIPAGKVDLDLSNLQKGIYLVKLVSENKTYTQRIVLF